MLSFVGRSVGKLSSLVSDDLAVAPCSRYALVVSINQPSVIPFNEIFIQIMLKQQFASMWPQSKSGS